MARSIASRAWAANSFDLERLLAAGSRWALRIIRRYFADRHAGNRNRVLEGYEEAELGARSSGSASVMSSPSKTSNPR